MSRTNRMAFSIAALMGFSCVNEPGILGGGEFEPDVDSKTDAIIGGSTFTGLPAVGSLAQGTFSFCTGTLISPTRVVTAAHCVVDTPASQMTFVTGPSMSQIETRTRVLRAVAHPQYDDQRLINDIAYLDLEAQPAGVTPIPVNTEGMTSAWVNRELLHVGYGVNNGSTQRGGGIKRAVSMAITEVMATQFGYGGGGRNTCNGDSGGPALLRLSNGDYRVAGTTSYGDAGCRSYGVDTRVDAFLSFLGAGSTTTPTPPPVGSPVAQTLSDSQTLAKGQSSFYDNIPVRAGTSFRATLSGTGDADLYVHFGTRPTRTTYTCRPYAADSNEVCELTVPAGATEAFVAVSGYTATSFQLNVSYQE